MSQILAHRIRRVEREYLTCHAALVYAERYWGRLIDSDEWEGRTLDQVREAVRRLEVTYVIRLFSEFEGILRQAWAERGRDPDAVNVNFLIDHVADPRPSAELRQRVHEVQFYRNSLVHAGARPVSPLPLDEARKRLMKFIERLPDPTP